MYVPYCLVFYTLGTLVTPLFTGGVSPASCHFHMDLNSMKAWIMYVCPPSAKATEFCPLNPSTTYNQSTETSSHLKTLSRPRQGVSL